MISDVFDQMNNALLDLQASQHQTFERPMKALDRALHDPELSEINIELTDKIDLNAFLQASEQTQGGMVGSARLLWPEDPKAVMGLTILLIEKFAKDSDFALNFGFTFYNSGNKIIAGVHSFVRQMLIPFARDYKNYVSSRKNGVRKTITSNSKRIFIVHGHDGEARESVARFLERLGYEAVILHEQANRGRTIIEKVEANSDVGFAVVLLTPDDEGRAVGGDLEPRVRQNVLLELGYFIGLLGRDRVCALKRGVVNIPSDFAGVVWAPMDSENWKSTLAKELKAAGYEIDWNKVMR